MTTRRSNAWQLHVKRYAHDHGISYRKAMQESECKSTYHASKVTKEEGEHKVEFKTSQKLEKPTKRLTRKRMERDLEDIEKAMASLKKNSKQYKTLKEQTHSLRLRLASKPPKKTRAKPTSEPPSEPPPEPTPEPQPEPSESTSTVD